MNNGQSHPSPAVRAITNEWLLAALRSLTAVGLCVVAFFLQRLVTLNDENMRRMEDFRNNIQSQVSEFKIDVARNTANINATILAIQDRQSAQSRRMDQTDGDVRDINKRFYEGRIGRP